MKKPLKNFSKPMKTTRATGILSLASQAKEYATNVKVYVNSTQTTVAKSQNQWGYVNSPTFSWQRLYGWLKWLKISLRMSKPGTVDLV